MSVPRILLMLMRVGAALQVVVGIGLWEGRWYSLVSVHETIGILFVLLLWTIAVIALVQRRAVGIAVLAILWGLLVALLGFTQQGILPGNLHWIVRVLHLAIGLASLGIAEVLAPRRPGPVS